MTTTLVVGSVAVAIVMKSCCQGLGCFNKRHRVSGYMFKARSLQAHHIGLRPYLPSALQLVSILFPSSSRLGGVLMTAVLGLARRGILNPKPLNPKPLNPKP